MELLWEMQSRIVVDILKQPLPILEVPFRQSIQLGKSKLSEHKVLSIETTSFSEETFANRLYRVDHTLVLRHLVERLHNLQQMTPVLHQYHLCALHQQNLNRR